MYTSTLLGSETLAKSGPTRRCANGDFTVLHDSVEFRTSSPDEKTMPKSADNLIVVRQNADAGQWTASFESVPQFAFGGGTAIGAVCRLLEGAESDHGTYTIECFSDLALAEQAPASIVWDPPELLVPCPDCNGRGEYVGLLHVERCRTCAGRMVVPG
jgi:hypothetical protein